MALVALTDFDIPNSHFAILKFYKRSSLLQMSLTVDFPMLYFNIGRSTRQINSASQLSLTFEKVLEIFLRTILHTFSLSSIGKTVLLRFTLPFESEAISKL